MQNAKVSDLGDLICPYCGAAIITPTGYEVRSGVGTCPLCRKEFRVTEEIAEEANRKGKDGTA